jgi:predicted metal-dependent phosphoesterase TrpH
VSRSSQYPEYIGVIHCHSRFSFDSLTPIRSILGMAVRLDLDFVILTDHGTVEGSRALRKLARRNGVDIEIPLAAEYRTECGDLIAAFIDREVEQGNWKAVVADVRSQGGLLLLPHPYEGHPGIEGIAADADLIEVFNARLAETNNQAAKDLAGRLGKPGYWAPDAHIPSTFRRAIVGVERVGSLRESLLRGRIRPVQAKPASAADLLVSQFIKYGRAGDASATFRLLRDLTRGALRRVRRAGGRLLL